MSSYRKLDFAKIDELRKASEINHKLQNEYNTLKQENDNLENKLEKNRNRMHEIDDGLSNNSLDDYAIFTILSLDGENSDECHLDYIDKDIMFCHFYYGSGYRKDIAISLLQLQEYGFVEIENYGFVCNGDVSPSGMVKIIYSILRQHKGEIINNIKHDNDRIAEYEKELEQYNKEIKTYDNVQNETIRTIFNDIHFGLTKEKVEDVLNAFPRKVEIK